MKRLVGTVLGLALLGVGLLALGVAERSLWTRAPAEALDRYVPDRVLPGGLPPAVTEDELVQLCSLSRWARPWRSRDRAALCLDGRLPRAAGAPVAELRSRWRRVVEDQIAYATAVDAIDATTVATEVERLRGTREALRATAGGPLLRLHDAVAGERPPPSEPTAPAVPSTNLAEELAGTFFTATRQYTLARLALIGPEGNAPQTDEAAWRQARDLGLLAAGLRIDHDSAREPPRPVLLPDRRALGSRLDWARRAQARSGGALERTLTGWLPMLSLSAVLAVLVAGGLGASPVATALLFLLAGLGALHQIDIAVTGPVALRHVPTRSLGEAVLGPGLWEGAAVWLPALAFLGALVATRLAARRLRLWTDRILRSPWPAVAATLALAAAAAIAVPASPALRTELLSLIAAVGGGLFMARYAPLIGAGSNSAGLGIYALPLLSAALATAALASFSRVDPLGTAGVLALTGLLAALLLAHRWTTRLVCLGLVALGLWTYGHFLTTGEDVSGIIDHVLPRHGRQRFMAVYDPLAYGAPDVKQVEWLCRSAGGQGLLGLGWGFGNVPWSGLPGVSRAQPLPIPAVSDLSWVMLCAVGGTGYALAVVSTLVATLLVLVRRGLCTALGTSTCLTERFLGAAAGLGLLTATIRVIVNLAGNWQVLPLAGVPVVFIAHAPAAATFALAYAGIVLGASASREAGFQEPHK